MSNPLARVLEALGERVVRHRQGSIMARCPAHEDRDPSLSVKTGDDGRVLLKCFAGCAVESIVSAIGLTVADLYERREATIQPVRQRANNPKTTSPTGVTLAEYAKAKSLPEEFLRGVNLTEITYLGQSVLRIPYYSPDGSERAVQFRLSLDAKGDRFRWRRGSKPVPYGLNRLTPAPSTITLVEGCSDSQTLWYHDQPALGVPGATMWRAEWDTWLDGIDTIYVVIEPDRGGEAVTDWIARASFRDRVRLVRLDGVKDPSDLYLLDPAAFLTRWQAALDAAPSWTDQTAAKTAVGAAADFALAKELLMDPQLMTRVAYALRLNGYAGDVRPALLAFLAVVSRLLGRPQNLAFVALSSAGKSFVVEAALALHPAEAVFVMRAGSALALVYADESFEHRVVLVAEADSIPEDGPAASAIRALAADNEMAYDVVEKDAGGRFGTRHIVKPGPTGLLTTSTKSLPPQMSTRVLEISLSDDPNQTRAVLHAHASTVQPGTTRPTVDLEPFHAAQRWLAAAGEHRVSVPFATRLAALVPADAVRMRRDFRQLLTTIQASALLHQLQRPPHTRRMDRGHGGRLCLCPRVACLCVRGHC